jgi:hypothetical protein
VLIPHNRARVPSMELKRLDELHRIFTSRRWKRRIPPAARCASKISDEVIDQLRGIEPPRPESGDPDKLN